jgi:hypothetical protein
VNSDLDVKANDERSLGCALHLSCFFRSRRVWTFAFILPCTVHAFYPNVFLIIASPSLALPPKFAQNLMDTRFRSSRDMPSGEIQDSKY